MTAIVFPSQRVLIRETFRIYKLKSTPGCPGDTGTYMWIFPRVLLPTYVVTPWKLTESLTVRRQIYWTWVIFHTTHLGDYREVKDYNWGQGEERIYERLY